MRQRENSRLEICKINAGFKDIIKVILYLNQWYIVILDNMMLQYHGKLIRASQGFDGVLESGEASRCDTLITQLKLNANDNVAYAA